MEPAVPTGQEILEQLNQLEEKYGLSGNDNSTKGGGNESHTSPSLEEGTQSPPRVDYNVATSLRPAPTSPPPTLYPVTPSPLIPLLLLSRLLPPFLLWRFLPPYVLPSRHHFPHVYAQSLRGLINKKLAWGMSQIKATGNRRNGRPLKRERSHLREPRLLSIIQQRQEKERELAMPAQINKALLQNQVGLLFFKYCHDYEKNNFLTSLQRLSSRLNYTLIVSKGKISMHTPPQSRAELNSTNKTKKQ